jgi:ATP synthase protein I
MTSTEAHNGEKSPPSTPESRRDAAAPLAKKTRGYMQVLSLSSVGIEMAVSVVIGLFGGQWIDRKLDTEPLFLLVGVLIGSAAAGKAVWRAVKKADRIHEPGDGGGSS